MLVKEDFLTMKKLFKNKSRKLSNALEACSRALLPLKRECDSLLKYDSIDIESFVLRTLRLCTAIEEALQTDEHPHDKTSVPLLPQERELLLNFYFDLRSFQNIYELLDEYYIIYGDYSDRNHFQLHLQCMDPSVNLDSCLKKGRCSVFFSATLLPIHYYKEQLAGREDDYAIYAPSPFVSKNRLLMIGQDVSTKYTRRGPLLYQKLAQYILAFARGKSGNYLVFFPSYRMMDEVYEELRLLPVSENSIHLYTQKTSMTEEEREEFLEHFQPSPTHTAIGLCVMGGIFSEGIDLRDSRLIGTVIVGTGLPMVCTENELFREYFDKEKGAGFSYAYQYPGMNKVLQAAGRVIRTTSDVGAILLLDDRFLQSSYQRLFPREWFPYDTVTLDSLPEHLSHFWNNI